MIITPDIPGGLAVFCDDVRQEINGKTTIIGAYGGDMLIPGDVPAAVPQLLCFIWWRFDPDNLPPEAEFTLRHYQKDGQSVELATVMVGNIQNTPMPPPQVLFGEGSKKAIGLNVALRVAPLVVDGPCTIRALATIGDKEYRLGTLAVYTGVQPNPLS